MASAAMFNSNASFNKSMQKRNISPRNNNTLRANGAKIAIPVDDNVKSHIKRVEDWIGNA